jgi:hypothetical protein
LGASAYVLTAVLHTLQLSGSIGEKVLIELEIAPLEALHPETVVVEHSDRDISLLHTIQESINRVFIIVGRETGCKPEAKGPRRRKSGATSENAVFVDNVLGTRPVNKVYRKRFARNSNVDASRALRLNFQ